jgi:tetratricopeptide (TPR) repeat protein
LKFFLNTSRARLRLAAMMALLTAIAVTFAFGDLPSWIRDVEGKSAIEAAFFRMIFLPGGAVAFRRPPSESRSALGELIKAHPHDGELYSLRALEDEQELDAVAAEIDWKAYVGNSSDKTRAQLALADFYHRRVRPMDELRTLSLVAATTPIAPETLAPPVQQRSWQAFERIFGIIQNQGLPKDVSIAQYRAWIERYPQEHSLYTRFMEFLVSQKEYGAAQRLIAEYRKQFPDDQIFPLKADAMVEYRRGSVKAGLSVYERNFRPLWDPELVKSYFDLLRDTQSLRKFRDDANAALAANPEDLNAAARIFYYYQQQGKIEAAQQAIADFRVHKDAAKSPWTSQELFVCARLLEEIHVYPESARYYFALYNSKDLPDAPETAIAGLTGVLLTAPESPIRFGSGELSMYRDIATLDPGPGYLNGVLSLILNSTQPASQFSQQEQRAVPYFHRARAAELLALLDSRFPKAARRAELHAQLLEFYSDSGESSAVIQGGREFLAAFPAAPERTSVSLLMADAFARTNASKDEFAIYDAVLQELAAKAQNVPLGMSGQAYGKDGNYSYAPSDGIQDSSADGGGDFQSDEGGAVPRLNVGQSFQLGIPSRPAAQAGPRSQEYSRVLERYLARLVEMKAIPAALAVLRGEIDRHPDDPGLYERLATFLDQNRLGAQQEEVYRVAISRFADKSWYDKLARFYLRHKKDEEFEQLTRDAIASFKGSELEQYFNGVVGGSPQIYLRLNLLANQRFPHNPVFVRNLLNAYQAPGTRDADAWQSVLRQHWFEDVTLRNEFFEFLSRSHRLESELSAIRERAPDGAAWEKNPAAADFIAYGDLWRSHFEEGAPVLKSLAEQYPADAQLAHDASSVYRSLAYYEPAGTAVAAKIEDQFLKANPGDTETMARIGDIYADREMFAQAAPYWERIPQVDPGKANQYLDAATIYWDYFDFGNALRLLSKGREHLSDPNLYAYEEGAIYENERDYPRAIEQYIKGALAAPGSSAESRLLVLARRPKLSDLVDHETAKIAAGANSEMTATLLRVKVLEAQNRRQEMELFLDSLVKSVSSIEQAEEIEKLAQQKSLEIVRQHAIEQQVVLTTDPVTRLQLRYALIQLYEARKDFDSAQKNIEAIYRENPMILGVVRSTVDFYWRRKMKTEAISVLLHAAKGAYPDLSAQFSFEAARKSTEARQFQQARDLLAGLLKDSPYQGEYLAALADAYAQAGDDPGLERFYRDEIAALRNASLAADARRSQIATLRRDLIPALTRMKNYSGAVDQYIELINSFPEDDGLVTEASLYAQRYQRQKQFADFYAKTVAQSPRDSRWSIVLAHVQTNLEDYPAAIDAYTKSISIRPDRADLYISRAELEERLMRFDGAGEDYERLYRLAFNDPQWMEKLAAVRARQGKTREAVGALRAALIDGRPESAGNYFEVARRLEGFGMLDQARAFAEHGVATAGGDLLARNENHAGVKTYVRVMTRLRQQEPAYATLQKALEASSAELPVLKEQVQKKGVLGLTDAQWRENVRRNRVETARAGMAGALDEMGIAVNQYFTPEERLAFSRFAETIHNSMNVDDVDRFAIPLAQSAALADQEVRWRFDLLMEGTRRAAGLNHSAGLQSLVELQRRRGRFAELGVQMEQYAGAVAWQQRNPALGAAADAYYSAADETSELRILASIYSAHNLDANRQQRYFDLLLEKQPQELVRIASTWPGSSGEEAANYAVAHGSVALARQVVQARSKARPPVWNKAYDALVGLYFVGPASQVDDAFLGALGDETIGERVAKPVDRDRQLAGNTWFYYGSRYGEYLGDTHRRNSEDYLPAMLEESPASAAEYLMLAKYYAEGGDTQRAIEDYDHLLDLSPDRPDVHDDLALAYEKQADHTSALAQWKQAFAVLLKQLNSTSVPESFWRDFGGTCDQLRERHRFSELKSSADTVVRTYLQHNGSWRSNAVLRPAFAAQDDPASATTWLLDVSSSATDAASILADVADASWIPVPQRSLIYQRILELKERSSSKLDGLARDSALQELFTWQARYIAFLIKTKQYSAAAIAIAEMPKETADSQRTALVPLRLQIAAHTGTLDAELAAYHADPQSMPDAETLRKAAGQLLASGDKQSARKILELVFAREIEEHKLVATNFLGLAEIRLSSGDTQGAIELLRRLVVAVGSPYEYLDAAAALLEQSGRSAEASEFLDELVKSAPWDAGYRLRLAKAKLASGADAVDGISSLQNIASEQGAPYDVRLQAAVVLQGKPHANLGSGELNLLAGGLEAIRADAADKFYYYEARIKAAELTTDAQTKFLLLSHCVIDFPRRDAVRVSLFQAASGVESDHYAIGILDPSLSRQVLNRISQAGDEEEQRNTASDEEEDEHANEASVSGSSDAQLTRAQKAHVAGMIGDTMIRLARTADALPYYQAARSLESSARIRKILARKIASTKNVLKTQQENAERQPLLHEALEQDRVVRPRLAAASQAQKGTQQ